MANKVAEKAAEPEQATGGATISVEKAAKLLMVTPRRVQQLARDGWIPRAAGGGYPTVGVVQGYIRFLQDEQRRASRSAAENRVRDARAQEIELRVALRKRTLIDTEEAIGTLDEIVGMVRAETTGLPARITRDLPLRRKIEQELDAIFHRVSDRLAEKADALRKSGDAVAAGGENDAGRLGTEEPGLSA